MSIEDEIRDREARGMLHQMRPRLAGLHTRMMYVSETLYQELNVEAAQPATAYRMGVAVRDLDRFSSGAPITVGYGREVTCFMKPLDPRHDEVWEIRSRDPKPGVRFFGRFAARDVFIATHKGYREQLGGYGDDEWKREIRRCKAAWRALFHEFPPFSGGAASEYIGGIVVEVGNLP